MTAAEYFVYLQQNNLEITADTYDSESEKELDECFSFHSGAIVWTEDEFTEMNELQMTEREYHAYKNMAGIDEYSISTVEDAETKDETADKNEGWYDTPVEPEEVAYLNQQNEEYRVREAFMPRDSNTVIKEENITDDKDNSPTTPNVPVVSQSSEDVQHSNSVEDADNTPIIDSTNSTDITDAPLTEKDIQQVQTSNHSDDTLKEETIAEQYKNVNPASKNRRERNRDKTPESTNRTKYSYQYYTRVTFKLHIQASDDPIMTIRDTVKELLRELYQIDNKLALLPWKEASNLEPLTTSTSIPNTITTMNKYLQKLFVPKKGTERTIYPHIRIGHDIDFHTIREDIYSWVNNCGHGIFYNMLQAEDAVEIGWLLYSTREMDAGALADEVIDAIGCNIGLRWKVISTGSKQISQDNMVRALAVECSAKLKWRCQNRLLKLYSRAMKAVKEYPNGIRLRFVKVKKSAVNSTEKSKMDKLRGRQKDFLNAIMTTTIDEIVQIDYSPEAGKQPTLRQMIMELKSVSNVPLFHCVDLDWRMEGFTFQYAPNLQEEVETTLHTLLPLLHHYYPDADVMSHFLAGTETRCMYMKWDDTKQMIVDTMAPNETEEIESEENLVGFYFDMTGMNDPITRPSAPTFQPHENDSVSTLKSNDRTTLTTATSIKKASHTNPIPTHTLPSSNVSISQQTVMTVESYQHLDSRITGLASQLIAQQKKSNSQFESIMQSLQQLQQTPIPPPDKAMETVQEARGTVPPSEQLPSDKPS